MSTPDRWGPIPVAWERTLGAIAVSRVRGWEWKWRKTGSADLEELIGYRTTETHDDVVLIQTHKDPLTAIGARFGPDDWGKQGTHPQRGLVVGAPDEVLVEVLSWAAEDVE